MKKIRKEQSTYGYDKHVKDGPHCQFPPQEHIEHGLSPKNLSCIPTRVNISFSRQRYQTKSQKDQFDGKSF